jgi:hypothetical protein
VRVERRDYGLGTWVEQTAPWGWFRQGRVICSDGRLRRTDRLAECADTFFSVPAKVKVNGKTVSGYITFETAEGFTTASPADPTCVKFIAHQYGKNASELPRGAWRRT